MPFDRALTRCVAPFTRVPTLSRLVHQIYDGLAPGDLVQLVVVVHGVEDLVQVHLDLENERGVLLRLDEAVDQQAAADQVVVTCEFVLWIGLRDVRSRTPTWQLRDFKAAISP